MLFTSSDEDVGAILEQYSEMEKTLETNLMMICIKSEGRISLSEVYQMPYQSRERFVESFNKYVEEKNKQNTT